MPRERPCFQSRQTSATLNKRDFKDLATPPPAPPLNHPAASNMSVVGPRVLSESVHEHTHTHLCHVDPSLPCAHTLPLNTSFPVCRAKSSRLTRPCRQSALFQLSEKPSPAELKGRGRKKQKNNTHWNLQLSSRLIRSTKKVCSRANCAADHNSKKRQTSPVFSAGLSKTVNREPREKRRARHQGGRGENQQ